MDNDMLEQLGQYVTANTPELIEQERQKGQYLVPPPPKPGEIIVCQNCGKPMYPENFSTNITERKWEFKWHMHWECKQEMEMQLDLKTPGLMADRKSKGR